MANAVDPTVKPLEIAPSDAEVDRWLDAVCDSFAQAGPQAMESSPLLEICPNADVFDRAFVEPGRPLPHGPQSALGNFLLDLPEMAESKYTQTVAHFQGLYGEITGKGLPHAYSGPQNLTAHIVQDVFPDVGRQIAQHDRAHVAKLQNGEGFEVDPRLRGIGYAAIGMGLSRLGHQAMREMGRGSHIRKASATETEAEELGWQVAKNPKAAKGLTKLIREKSSQDASATFELLRNGRFGDLEEIVRKGQGDSDTRRFVIMIAGRHSDPTKVLGVFRAALHRTAASDADVRAQAMKTIVDFAKRGIPEYQELLFAELEKVLTAGKAAVKGPKAIALGQAREAEALKLVDELAKQGIQRYADLQSQLAAKAVAALK